MKSEITDETLDKFLNVSTTTEIPEGLQEEMMNNTMTPSQERHLLHLKGEFIRKLDAKYRAGAAEHGGDIRDNSIMQLVDEGLAECVDQYTYLSSIKAELMGILERGDAMGPETARKIYGDLSPFNES